MADLTYFSGNSTGSLFIWFFKLAISCSFHTFRLICQIPKPNVVAGNTWKCQETYTINNEVQEIHFHPNTNQKENTETRNMLQPELLD